MFNSSLGSIYPIQQTMEEAIAELTKRLPKIRSPAGGEKVYKDECAYSFDNPVCLFFNF